jgi:hypothetical protein
LHDPHALLSSVLQEYYSLINFATARYPRRLGLLGPKKEFQKKYIVPIVAARGKNASRYVVAEGERKNNELKELVGHHILRRLRKDHLSDRLSKKEDFVVFVTTSDQQRELMEDQLKRNSDRLQR